VSVSEQKITDQDQRGVAMTNEGIVVGKGTPAWAGPSVEGVVVDVKGPPDVIALMEADLSDKLILMHTAGATMLIPLFADLKGIICTAGGPGAHVAILSREFGVPCLVATSLTDGDLDGKRVRIEESGEVRALDA
jgi:phosphohistidine swiveling domain-containing protein